MTKTTGLDVFRKDIQKSTIRLVAFIVNAERTSSTVVWIVILLGCMTTFAYFASQSVVLFLGGNVGVRHMKLSSRPLEFPAVSICNLNPYKASLVKAKTPELYNAMGAHSNEIADASTKDQSGAERRKRSNAAVITGQNRSINPPSAQMQSRPFDPSFPLADRESGPDPSAIEFPNALSYQYDQQIPTIMAPRFSRRIKRATSSGAPDNVGTKFYTAFIPNYNLVSIKYQIMLATTSSAKFTVVITAANGTYVGQNVTIDNTQVYTIALTTNPLWQGMRLAADYDFVAYTMESMGGSGDGTMLIPADVLGTEYLVLGVDYYTTYPALLFVVGTEASTSVSVQVPNPSGSVTNFTLNEMEVKRFDFSRDTSGTRVIADKPVVVIAGHQCNTFPLGCSSCDLMYEQMPPINTFGQTFALTPFDRPAGSTLENPTCCKNASLCGKPYEFYKIVASQDGTTVIVKSNTSTSVVYNLNAGEYVLAKLLRTEYGLISATKPIIAAHLMAGNTFTGGSVNYGDPALQLIPPISSFSKDYFIVSCSPPFTQHYMTIVIDSSLAWGLSLNGNSFIGALTPNPIPGTNLAAYQYNFTCSGVAASFRITHSSSSARYGVTAYGYGQSVGYAYSVGRMFDEYDCTVSSDSTAPPDGKDNDCDGWIDEETRNFRDDDGDGQIDEDLMFAIPEIIDAIDWEIITCNMTKAPAPANGSDPQMPRATVDSRCLPYNLSYADVASGGACTNAITRTWRLIDKCGNIADNVTQMITLYSKPDNYSAPPTVYLNSTTDSTNLNLTGVPKALASCGLAKQFNYTYEDAMVTETHLNRTWTVSWACADSPIKLAQDVMILLETTTTTTTSTTSTTTSTATTTVAPKTTTVTTTTMATTVAPTTTRATTSVPLTTTEATSTEATTAARTSTVPTTTEVAPSTKEATSTVEITSTREAELTSAIASSPVVTATSKGVSVMMPTSLMVTCTSAISTEPATTKIVTSSPSTTTAEESTLESTTSAFEAKPTTAAITTVPATSSLAAATSSPTESSVPSTEGTTESGPTMTDEIAEESTLMEQEASTTDGVTASSMTLTSSSDMTAADTTSADSHSSEAEVDVEQTSVAESQELTTAMSTKIMAEVEISTMESATSKEPPKVDAPTVALPTVAFEPSSSSLHATSAVEEQSSSAEPVIMSTVVSSADPMIASTSVSSISPSSSTIRMDAITSSVQSLASIASASMSTVTSTPINSDAASEGPNVVVTSEEQDITEGSTPTYDSETDVDEAPTSLKTMATSVEAAFISTSATLEITSAGLNRPPTSSSRKTTTPLTIVSSQPDTSIADSTEPNASSPGSSAGSSAKSTPRDTITSDTSGSTQSASSTGISSAGSDGSISGASAETITTQSDLLTSISSDVTSSDTGSSAYASSTRISVSADGESSTAGGTSPTVESITTQGTPMQSDALTKGSTTASSSTETVPELTATSTTSSGVYLEPSSATTTSTAQSASDSSTVLLKSEITDTAVSSSPTASINPATSLASGSTSPESSFVGPIPSETATSILFTSGTSVPPAKSDTFAASLAPLASSIVDALDPTVPTSTTGGSSSLASQTSTSTVQADSPSAQPVQSDTGAPTSVRSSQPRVSSLVTSAIDDSPEKSSMISAAAIQPSEIPTTTAAVEKSRTSSFMEPSQSDGETDLSSFTPTAVTSIDDVAGTFSANALLSIAHVATTSSIVIDGEDKGAFSNTGSASTSATSTTESDSTPVIDDVATSIPESTFSTVSASTSESNGALVTNDVAISTLRNTFRASSADGTGIGETVRSSLIGIIDSTITRTTTISIEPPSPSSTTTTSVDVADNVATIISTATFSSAFPTTLQTIRPSEEISSTDDLIPLFISTISESSTSSKSSAEASSVATVSTDPLDSSMLPTGTAHNQRSTSQGTSTMTPSPAVTSSESHYSIVQTQTQSKEDSISRSSSGETSSTSASSSASMSAHSDSTSSSIDMESITTIVSSAIPTGHTLAGSLFDAATDVTVAAATATAAAASSASPQNAASTSGAGSVGQKSASTSDRSDATSGSSPNSPEARIGNEKRTTSISNRGVTTNATSTENTAKGSVIPNMALESSSAIFSSSSASSSFTIYGISDANGSLFKTSNSISSNVANSTTDSSYTFLITDSPRTIVSTSADAHMEDASAPVTTGAQDLLLVSKEELSRSASVTSVKGRPSVVSGLETTDPAISKYFATSSSISSDISLDIIAGDSAVASSHSSSSNGISTSDGNAKESLAPSTAADFSQQTFSTKDATVQDPMSSSHDSGVASIESSTSSVRIAGFSSTRPQEEQPTIAISIRAKSSRADGQQRRSSASGQSSFSSSATVQLPETSTLTVITGGSSGNVSVQSSPLLPCTNCTTKREESLSRNSASSSDGEQMSITVSTLIEQALLSTSTSAASGAITADDPLRDEVELTMSSQAIPNRQQTPETSSGTGETRVSQAPASSAPIVQDPVHIQPPGTEPQEDLQGTQQILSSQAAQAHDNNSISLAPSSAKSSDSPFGAQSEDSGVQAEMLSDPQSLHMSSPGVGSPTSASPRATPKSVLSIDQSSHQPQVESGTQPGVPQAPAIENLPKDGILTQSSVQAGISMQQNSQADASQTHDQTPINPKVDGQSSDTTAPVIADVMRSEQNAGTRPADHQTIPSPAASPAEPVNHASASSTYEPDGRASVAASAGSHATKPPWPRDPDNFTTIVLPEHVALSASSQMSADMPYLIFSMITDPKELQLLGYTYDEMVFLCNYNNRPCDVQSEIQTYFDPNYGNCFTFNHERGTHYTTRAGDKMGLQIIFNTPSNDYLPFVFAAGYKIALHEPDEQPIMDSTGMTCSPGIDYSFAVEKTTMTKVGSATNPCATNTTSGAESFYKDKAYTIDTCLATCYQKKVIEVCGCGDPHYAIPVGASYCNLTQRSCADKFADTASQFMSLSICGCLPACRTTVFDVVQTRAQWQMPPFVPSTCRERPPDEQDFCLTDYKRNYSKISIYYSTLSSVTLEEYALYDSTFFFADLSAGFGLWLGFCMISFAELVVFPILSLHHHVWHWHWKK